LKHHQQLNSEIVSERQGLRNMIADAARVARDLGNALDGQEMSLMAKVDRTKALADNVAELSVERLTVLFCFDDSFSK
jgi:hypothetical protein